ncbi:MAG: tRNA dihydrouridine synthase DusB [Deltaproteobacteria bacterium]|jgi:tRNA-dihydrouridine synthase B|nr:tRNA dihydrouridine synthase DusB [Deltaproteobacteria bacterium]
MSSFCAKGLAIGSLTLASPFVLAPMAGLTNWPFRRLALAYGAGLTFTEMVSSVALSHRGPKTVQMLKTDSTLEKPLAVQLFGRDADSLAAAAKVAVELGAGLVDLNFGCPAKKVIRSGHGAAIIKDPVLATSLAKSVVEAVTVPVTVKTRIAWAPDSPDIFQLAPRLADVGVAAITLHGRYGAQGFEGTADWSAIGRLAEKSPVPIIGSGDVTSATMAVERLKASGVAGVMIGRAARGRPWIFRRCQDLLAGREPWEPTNEDRLRVAQDHARWLFAEMGPRAAFLARTVLMWYARKLPGAAALRDAINHETDLERQLATLQNSFAGAGFLGVD